MKKVNIKTIAKADKTSIRTTQRKHCILLDWESKHYFSDIKEARTFLVKTNDFLTFKLFEFNEIYIEVFSHYRRAWFYLDNTQESATRAAISAIENNYKLIMDRSHWQNGPILVQNWIRQIANELNTALIIIEEMHRKRGNWAEMRVVVSSIRTRIGYLIAEVQKYPNLSN